MRFSSTKNDPNLICNTDLCAANRDSMRVINTMNEQNLYIFIILAGKFLLLVVLLLYSTLQHNALHLPSLQIFHIPKNNQSWSFNENNFSCVASTCLFDASCIMILKSLRFHCAQDSSKNRNFSQFWNFFQSLKNIKNSWKMFHLRFNDEEF